MQITAQNVTAAVVIAHALGALAKHFFHTPRQQAQIDAIETQVDTIATSVSPK